MELPSLPPEIIHRILFSYDTSAADVLNTALTCHDLHFSILGPVDAPNAYDVDQFRAKGGVCFCLVRSWLRAGRIALSRGYGDVSEGENYAVRYAAVNNEADLLETLLKDPTVDPSANNNEAISWASKNGHVEIVQMLLDDARVDATDKNWNHSDFPYDAVEMACMEGHFEVVALLLSDPKIKKNAGYTQCLVRAATNGHADIVSLLLANNVIDPSKTAIHHASVGGHADVVRVLLAESTLDPADFAGIAIKFSARDGHEDVVRVLLADPRVDPTVGDSVGSNAALRLAIENGREGVVELLLADPRVNAVAASLAETALQ